MLWLANISAYEISFACGIVLKTLCNLRHCSTILLYMSKDQFLHMFSVCLSRQAVSVVSEGLESFGGQGYIEDTGLPSMLRDAQVNDLCACVTSPCVCVCVWHQHWWKLVLTIISSDVLLVRSDALSAQQMAAHAWHMNQCDLYTHVQQCHVYTLSK